MSLRLIFASLFILMFVVVANAQTAQPSRPLLPSATDDDPHEIDQSLAEIRARNVIKREETLRAEMLGRAREVARLGSELRETFARAKSLTTEDMKKLARMEKLTRKIRGEAGGTNDGGEPSSELPGDKPSTVLQLAKLSDELRENVEKTPRHVVSATVVERANQLLEIIERLHQFSK